MEAKVLVWCANGWGGDVPQPTLQAGLYGLSKGNEDQGFWIFSKHQPLGWQPAQADGEGLSRGLGHHKTFGK
uniref:Uncharacterized protein n=1 Tax=Magnetococcus massalia (strain MO-1) TaxID=451514 RepID=A0A1S7LLF3_MAGMO|nr:protein of unknown function [Candidatus Magnetococcus massalia]